MSRLLTALATVGCLAAASEANAEPCSTQGLPGAVVLINGIWTGPDDIEADKVTLKARLEESLGCTLPVLVNYNTSVGTASDLLEAAVLRFLPAADVSVFWSVIYGIDSALEGRFVALASQIATFAVDELANAILRFNDEPTTQMQADIALHLALYGPFLTSGRQLVVVGHSQGNLFANREYELLIASDARLANQVGVVAIATPADTVAGAVEPPPYTNLRGDPVALLSSLGWNLPLSESDVSNPNCGRAVALSFELDCHALSTYLFEPVTRNKVISDVVSALEQGRLVAVDDNRDLTQAFVLVSEVSANDQNPHNLAATVEFLTPLPAGFSALGDDGGFRYAPAPSFVGTTVVRYRFHTLAGDSNIATLTIQVNASSVLSIARDDLGPNYSVSQGGVLAIQAPGVLGNDTYPIGSVVEFLLPLPPSVTNANPDGSFTIDLGSHPALTGPLTLQYVIRSANGVSNVATVTITVLPTQPPPPSCVFTDQFSRPDGTVGNGWFDMVSNTQGNLVTRNGALSTPGAGGTAGIYRPIGLSGPTTVSATFTYLNGFGGVPYRYDTSFLFGSNGTSESGYGIVFVRGDANFADSRIMLVLDGVGQEVVYSSFQFTDSLTTTFTWSPDGSITGSVSGTGNTFPFSFGPRAVSLSGGNLAIRLGFPDSRSGVLTHPTLDDLSITPLCGDAIRLNWTVQPNGDITYMQPPPWPAGDTYFGWQYMLRTRNNSTQVWGSASCYGGSGGSYGTSSFTTGTDFINYNGGMNVFGVAGPDSRGGIATTGCTAAGYYYFEIAPQSAGINVTYYYELYYDGVGAVTAINNAVQWDSSTLVALAVGSHHVRLSWQANGVCAGAQFDVQTSPSTSGPFTDMAITDATTITFSVPPSTTQYFRVAATCGGNRSAWSNTVSATTISELPVSAAVSATAFNDTIVVTSPRGYYWAGIQAYRYNTASDLWTSPQQSLGEYGDSSNAVRIGARIYITGGVHGWAGPYAIANLFIYDPLTDSWSYGANHPVPTVRGIAGAIDGNLYVYTSASFLDSSDGQPMDVHSFYFYNPTLDLWQALPLPPQRVFSGTGGAVDGRFYLVGGNDPTTGQPTGEVNVFDPATNSWSIVAPMPTPRYFASAVVQGTNLYVVGGRAPNGSYCGFSDAVEVFDVAANSWSSLPSLREPRASAGVAIVGDTMYVIGGLSWCGGINNDFTRMIELFDVRPD